MTHRGRTQSRHRGAKAGVRRVGGSRFRCYLAPMMRHVLLVAVAIAFLVPFYWMAISALKDNSQIFARPIQWWPNPVRWDNVLRTPALPGA
jgi:ABC-type glycerol-3-phosphate transport system permease component